MRDSHKQSHHWPLICCARVAIVLALCIITATTSGQAPTGKIFGIVTDADGRGVGGAPVEVQHTQTRTVYKTTSAPSGEFSLDALPDGVYALSVRRISGFNAYLQRGVALRQAEARRIDVRLPDDNSLNTLGEDRVSRAAESRRRAVSSGGPVPKTAEGKPDLSGLWYRPVVTDPAQPEMLDSAQRVFEERAQSLGANHPNTRCLPSSLGPMAPRLFRLVQTPALVVMLLEGDVRSFRELPLEVRSHPSDPNPTWYGDSIAAWEGDTLVVDTVGFNDRMWIDIPGHPHTDKLHVVERYTRLDAGRLDVQIVVDDPGAYRRPWTIKGIATLALHDRIEEFICNENNKDVEHLVGK